MSEKNESGKFQKIVGAVFPEKLQHGIYVKNQLDVMLGNIKQRIDFAVGEALGDLNLRLAQVRIDVRKRHPGGCVTYDNLIWNVYADWVKDWFGETKNE